MQRCASACCQSLNSFYFLLPVRRCPPHTPLLGLFPQLHFVSLSLSPAHRLNTVTMSMDAESGTAATVRYTSLPRMCVTSG